MCGAVPLAGYISCVVVVWRTRRGGSVPRVYTERSERSLVTSLRGRGPGIHRYHFSTDNPMGRVVRFLPKI